MKLIQDVNIEVDILASKVKIVNVYHDQDLFTEMDVEEDGNVYIKQVVVTLKALNKDIDHNLKVPVYIQFS